MPTTKTKTPARAASTATKKATKKATAGRPAGSTRPRTQDAALVARMAKLNKFFEKNEAVVKAGGIAKLAGLTNPDLTKLRAFGVPLTEVKVGALERATVKFLNAVASELGYSVKNA